MSREYPDHHEYSIHLMQDDGGPVTIKMPAELVEIMQGRSDKAKMQFMTFWVKGIMAGIDASAEVTGVRFNYKHLPRA